MGVKTWNAEAPSNIALIKYMGKSSTAENRPANSSLSFTLDNLRSVVEISQQTDMDRWEPLSQADEALKGQEKYLKHFQFLKKQFRLHNNYLVKSGNRFPSDCGLASSASSFAALTLATYKLALDEGDQVERSAVELSKLSRWGSGSSCRSFFSPWALWCDEGAEAVDLPYGDMLHQVVVVDSAVKKVSSSEAHKRVSTSPIYQERLKKAERRLEALIGSLRKRDWENSYALCWEEFQEMHALFRSAGFDYMTPATLEVLRFLDESWNELDDGPLITLDAGPNIHLLYRRDQAAFKKQQKLALENQGYSIL